MASERHNTVLVTAAVSSADYLIERLNGYELHDVVRFVLLRARFCSQMLMCQPTSIHGRDHCHLEAA